MLTKRVIVMNLKRTNIMRFVFPILLLQILQKLAKNETRDFNELAFYESPQFHNNTASSLR